jgi:hypothetical protein
MTHDYRVRVSDRLGPVFQGVFAGMRAVVVPRQILIEGWLSADELHALLRCVDRAGAQIVDIYCPEAGGRQLQRRAGPSRPSATDDDDHRPARPW